MRITLGLVCLLLCSCSRTQNREDSNSIPSAEAGQTAAQILATQAITNRYPGAQVVSERAKGQYSIYRLSTNGTVLPVELVVDRKTGNMTLQKVSH